MIPVSVGWGVGVIAAVVWGWSELRHLLLLRAFAAERRAWLVERQGLCDRIQGIAPTVVMEERPPLTPFGVSDEREQEAEEREQAAAFQMPGGGPASAEDRERFLEGSARWLGDQ